MEEIKTEKLLIIDASVAIKFLLGELEDYEIAEKLFVDLKEEKIEVLVPTHFFYETLNIIGLKAIKDSTWLMSQLFNFHFMERSLTFELGYNALSVMQKFPKVSFYDAVYHATAIQHNATFITADEKYYEQAKSLKHIKLLKDYK